MGWLTKQVKEYLEKDPFFCYGRVHPSEYDWKEQYGAIARMINISCDPYVTVDAGKLLGLAAYAAELERKLSERSDEEVEE